MKGKIDLHLHTVASDGTWTPYDLVDAAIELGYRYIAITDHDAIDSVPIAIEYAKNKDITIIPGVELSIEHKKQDVHLLVYGWNIHKNEKFVSVLNHYKESRLKRAKEIVEKLNLLGCNITFEELEAYSKDGSLGRPHIAQALIDKNCVKDLNEAFAKYLHNDGPAYVKKEKLTAVNAMKIAKDVNGITVLAHPGLYPLYNDNINDFLQLGVDGIEVFHSNHDNTMTKKLLNIALSNNLLVTGGSDCHGKLKSKQLLGTIELPEKYFIRFIDVLNQRSKL